MKQISILFLIIFYSCFIFQRIEEPKYKPSAWKNVESSKVKFYWIGHATVLIQLYDKWIITDPNFNDTTGVVVKRFVYPGINTQEIGKVAIALISHNHFDHLDQPTLRQIKPDTVLVPSGGATYIPNGVTKKIIPVSENGWETYNIDSVLITPVPVKHFGGRWLIDNIWDGEPYTGYVIRYKDITIFFGGDTGYDEKKFISIGDAFNIDVALIPVGPVGLLNYFIDDKLGSPFHVNPFGAIQILKDTRAEAMIPIHHSTFYRKGGREYDLLLESIKEFPSKEKIYLIEQGECLEFREDRKLVSCNK
jgi:L-ascorbate metabolism protein UlaG (beta-lactamase superfamily)